MLSHLKIKKGLLIYEKKEDLLDEDPLSGKGGIRTLDTVIPYTDFPGLLIRPL